MTVRQGFVVGSQFDPETAFRFAAGHGFDAVELDMEHAFHPGRVDPERVRALADEHDLVLVVHLPYRVDPGSPHDHAREGACRTLEAALDVAAEFEAEKAVMHAATTAHGDVWDPEAIRAGILASVRRVAAHGRSVGVEVCAENLKGPYFDVHDFPLLFDETDAAMCLDTGHAHVSGMDAAEQGRFLREHGGRVSHVHLNDTRRADDDEHLPVGLGRLDFGALAAAMDGTDWEGTATHEIYGFDLAYAAHGKRALDGLLDGRAD